VVTDIVAVELWLEVVESWLEVVDSWLLAVETWVLDDNLVEEGEAVVDDVVLIREALYIYSESRLPAPQYSVLLPVHNI
jgi:hypothetical protein